jgi:hypothetical protein
MAEHGQAFTNNTRPEKRARHEPPPVLLDDAVVVTVEDSVDRHNQYAWVANGMLQVADTWCVREKSEIDKDWLEEALKTNNKYPKQMQKQMRILIGQPNVAKFMSSFEVERRKNKLVEASVANLGLAIALVEVSKSNGGPFYDAMTTAKNASEFRGVVVPSGIYTYITAVCANPDQQKGAGTHLIRKIIEDAKQKKHYAVVLRTATRNLVDFYEMKFGFEAGHVSTTDVLRESPLMVLWLINVDANLRAMIVTEAFKNV